MTKPGPKPLRCAIYTRVSTDHGLEQDFNSLQAQREAAEAKGHKIDDVSNAMRWR